MKDFFHVKTSLEEKRPGERLKANPLGVEVIPITQALGRIVAEGLVSHEDIPPFNRSTIDGYAVCAKDTFGATKPCRPCLKLPVKCKWDICLKNPFHLARPLKYGQAEPCLKVQMRAL